MNNEGGNFKKLVRNLRTKKYEKIHFIRNDASISHGEKSKESSVRPKKNSDSRE